MTTHAKKHVNKMVELIGSGVGNNTDIQKTKINKSIYIYIYMPVCAQVGDGVLLHCGIVAWHVLRVVYGIRACTACMCLCCGL